MVTKSENGLSAGEYIRSLRVSHGLSLRDVAAALGVSHVFLGEVERGARKTMKAERLEQLEEVLPGFHRKEFERLAADGRDVRLPSVDGPAFYRDLGVALARSMHAKDLTEVQASKILKILRGDDEDE